MVIFLLQGVAGGIVTNIPVYAQIQIRGAEVDTTTFGQYEIPVRILLLVDISVAISERGHCHGVDGEFLILQGGVQHHTDVATIVAIYVFVSGGLYTCLLVIRGITYDIVDDITTVCYDHEGPLFLRRELLETNKYVVRIAGIQIRVTDRDIRRVRDIRYRL